MRRFCSSLPKTTMGWGDVDRGDAAHGGTGLGDGLHHQRRLGDAQPGAAIFGRHGDAEPAVGGHGGDEFVRESAIGVARQPVVGVEAGAKPGYGVADGLLLGGQREVHGALLSGNRLAPSLQVSGFSSLLPRP
jgi:hypothetical protein